MSVELKKQPFLRGLKDFPEKRKKDVNDLRKWLEKQPHLPNLSDEYLLLFLHACYYNNDKARNAIECYFTIRTNNPALWDNRDMFHPKVKIVYDMSHMCPLPELTPQGYQALLYVLSDTDCTKFSFADALKAFCMFNDVRLSEDGLAAGYIVLFDMKGCTIGHLARVTLPALRAFMEYIQDGHPARLKAIHVLHTAAFVSTIMRLVQPLIHSELMNILKFHKELPPEEDVPLKMLPEEYGGQALSKVELHKQHRHLLETDYYDWLKQSGDLKCNESKRPKKKSFALFSSNLEID